MAYRILIAEENQETITKLKVYLENAQYCVFIARNGKSAYHLFHEKTIDLIIIDLGLAKFDSNTLIQKIRKTSIIPIIALSDKNEAMTKVHALNLGADDYMLQTISPLEMLARVNAHLRRCYEFNRPKIVNTLVRVGNLVLDSERFRVEKAGSKIPLTVTEFKLLQILMESPGRVFTKSQLYEMINDRYAEGEESTVMTHISNIRDKIEDNAKSPIYIKTVRGVGYKIEKEDEVADAYQKN